MGQAQQLFEQYKSMTKEKLFEQYIGLLEDMADDYKDKSILSCARAFKEALADIAKLKIDHDRYEALRKCNARQFANLYARTLSGDNFDMLVDQLLQEQQGPCCGQCGRKGEL